MNPDMETQEETIVDPLNCINDNSYTKEDSKALNVPDTNSQDHPTRTDTPRRVKDIHLDGSVDDMQNVDPYMLDEKDLDIQSEVGGHAGTMSSNMSVSSWKLLHLPKSRETKSVASSIDRSDISRARRLKQHERSPFLSIDVPSENNSARSINQRAVKTKSPLYGSQHSLLSVSTTGLTSQQSGRSSVADRITSARQQEHKLFSSSSSLVPPGSLPHYPNHNIKKPFKHDVKDVELAVPPVNPAIDLKDRTAVATHAINKILRAQKPSRTHYIQGRLLKARLKPLEPVKFSEPTIQQCRGIISETRKYSQCDSRTLQRWRAIMTGARVQPHQEAVREGASTSESIHRTSEASTPDLAMANADDLDVNVFEDKIWMDELNKLINGGRDSAVEGERIIPFPSLPHSRSEPGHCGEELSIIQGPDFESMYEQGVMIKQDTADESMTEKAQEIVAHLKTEQYPDSSKKEPSSESVISATTEESMRKFSDDTESFHKDSFVTGSPSKRPHSATYPQESVLPRTSSILRPKTAVDSSHKAVRFADEDVIKGSLQNDLRGKGALKPKGNKGKSSCRPHSLDSGFDDKDEPGDGNGRGDHIRTFLTQDPPKSTTSGESVTSRVTVNSSQQEEKSKKANDNGRASFKGDISKTNASLGSDRSSPQKSSSSQKFNMSHDGERSLFDNQNSQDQNLKDNAVTASIVYNDMKVNENPLACEMLSKGRPKEVQQLVKESDLKENMVAKDKEVPNYKETLSEESKNTMLSKINTGDKSFSSEATVLQVTGDKLNIPESDQKARIAMRQKDFDYDKYSRAPSKHTTSSARRAKAYKNLIKKTRKENSPLNYNAFISQKREKSSSKDRRSHSASNFSERSSIQSKYGPLKENARPSSVSTEQSGRSSRKQMPKKQISGSEMHLRDTPSKDEYRNYNFNVPEDKVERKARLKSISKVTFADENDWRTDNRREGSTTSTIKTYNKKSLSSFGSCDSLLTHHTSSVSDDGILGADFNRMWEEIPSYDSDDDDEDGAEGDVGEDEAGFELLSKFDDLEIQFEQLKSEMAHERQKLITNCMGSFEDKCLVGFKKREPETFCTSHPEALSENNGNLDMLLFGNITGNVMVTGSSNPIFVTLEPELECQGLISSPPSDLKNEVITSNVGDSEPTTETSLVISSSLYKKTNFYVEVSKSSSSSSHKQRSQSQTSLRKGKAMKCVPIEDAALSHAEEKPNNESQLLNLEGTKTEQSTSASEKGSLQAVTSAVPLTNDCTSSESALAGEINENLHLSQKMSLSLGRSQKTQTDPSETKTQGKSNKIWSKQKRHNSNSSSKIKKTLGTKHQNQPKKVTEYENYSDILLAYRQYCMEDSESEQEEEEEEENDQLGEGFSNLNYDPKSDRVLDSDCLSNLNGFQENEHGLGQPEKRRTLNVHPTLKINISESNEMIKTKAEEQEKRKVIMNDEMDMNDEGRNDEIPGNKNELKKKAATRSSESNSNALEIVAKPKVLSKISKPTMLPDGDMETLCKFPPICFQLNAKPPSGFFYYFAYDQNMNPDRLATYLNVANPPPRFWALLFGFKLVFNMKVPTVSDAESTGGQANILYNPDASVEGCIYQLTLQQLASLDKFMGYPLHYEHVVLPVWMSNCLDSHNLGLAQYCVPALTFVAQDCCTYQGSIQPNNFAVEQCLKSADILSSQYKEHIQSFLPSEIPIVKAIEAAGVN